MLADKPMLTKGRCRPEGPMMFRPRESMLADRPMLTQGSMPAGRADDFPTKVDAGWNGR
jgi:hypothetical protein